MTEDSKPTLKRELGLYALLAYGIGDILGAGIYAVVGAVAAVALSGSWMSFAIALTVASLTGLTYAELGSRFPRSGGEAYFCQQAFKSPSVSTLIGWLVFCSGVVSLATITRAFAGYLHDMRPEVPAWPIMAAFITVLGLINFRGIRQSSTTNIVCTIVESSGLLIVLVAGTVYLLGPGSGEGVSEIAPAPLESAGWFAVVQGATLAFFAFIGFEDMVNIAEEVKEPRRNFPRAILTALFVTGFGYIAIVFIATKVATPAVLADSDAPLLEVVRIAAPSVPPWLFAVIALFAVSNTGLLNFVMASRLLYGMAAEGLIDHRIDRIHPVRRTPHVAILVVYVAAIALAFSGTLTYLAGTTSVLLLITFSVINLALLRVKARGDDAEDAFVVPMAVPVAGFLTCFALLFFVRPSAFLSSLVLFAGGLAWILWRARRAAKPRENLGQDGQD